VSTELLISSDPWENRVAILEDGQLAEVYFEREEKVIGSIYKGKVQNVLPGMGASFVDIGLGRNAFLYVDDINKTPLNIGDVEITQGRSGYTITEKVNRGDDVLVQIVKEPRGLKGARISTNISLPGRYLILMPTGRYSGVSRKIESAEDRNRLKGIMKMIRPEGMATVVRTAAANISQAELIADLGVLIRMWHGILESYKRAPAPSLIHKDMNLVYKAARDFITPEVDRVLIDNAEEFEKVRDFMRLLGPQYVERIQHYNHGKSLFKDFKIEEEVDRLLRPTIKLPSGGSIVIETTEALTVIDINSGKFTGGKNLEDTIVRTNVEAAAEIARQVRLRDIGGIIVCDFIDMNSEASRTRVITTLETGLRKDRTRTTIQSFSALGLLEFTRKRVGKDLSGQLRGACPTCSGLGTVMSPETVAIDAFRQLRRFGLGSRGSDGLGSHEHANGHAQRPIEIVTPPTVGAQIEYWYEDELAALEKEVEAKISVRVDASMHPERTKIERSTPGEGSAPGVRVGDEIDVDLVQMRLPNPTSALAVVNGRLVEVEGAGNSAGQSVKIKIIDIDDDGNVLAEPRGAVTAPAMSGETKRRRRRGGRGRTKPLTTEEQTEELMELAEEAAKGQEARPVIGISTVSEAEAEHAEVRASTAPPIAVAGTLAGAADIELAEPAGDGLSYASYGGKTDEAKRKRRRRRRRSGAGTGAAAAPGLAEDAAPGSEADDEIDEADDLADEAMIALGTAPAATLAAAAAAAAADAAPEGSAEGEEVRRRRRRRRRRGRGGAGVEGNGARGPEDDATAERGSAPDRQIFRVGSDGSTEATGELAPPEPGRAIAARRNAPIAVDAPPPSLSATEEPPKLAKPSRGRRRVDDFVGEPPAALPPAAGDTEAPGTRGRRAVRAEPEAVSDLLAEPVVAPKRRGRPPGKAAATVPATAPVKPVTRAKVSPPAAKPAAKKVSSTKRTAVKAAPASKAAPRARVTAKPAAAKPAAASKRAAAGKAAAVKARAKAPAAKKAAPARKKSSTSTRKK